MRLKIAFISILCLSSIYCIDPFTRGQYEVDHVSINPEVFGELDHHLEVFAPRFVDIMNCKVLNDNVYY